MGEGLSSGNAPLSSSEERNWAMFAHLSILLNLVSGFLGVIAAVVIYALYRDRSRYVAFQSFQAFLFQLIFWGGAGIVAVVIWVLATALSVVLVGLLCIPIALLLSLIPAAALVYGIVGAIQCSQGADFRYLWVGDWALSLLDLDDVSPLASDNN